MGALQTSSALNRLPLRAPERFVRVRSRKPRRIEARASTTVNCPISLAGETLDKDWAAIQRAIAGDRQAQENLFLPYTAKLYRIALSVLRNKEDAEDALQNALLQAYLNLGRFQGRSSFFSWLTRITINSALMLRRKRNSHPEPSLDESLNGEPDWFEQVADARPTPEIIYSQTETNALVDQHLRQLSPEMQTAFRLRVQNGFSIKESCRVVGTSASTFKSRVSRARQKLACGLRQSFERSRRFQP
jgi:RNA polymerase sigma-70 factor (ECF subfamily)